MARAASHPLTHTVSNPLAVTVAGSQRRPSGAIPAEALIRNGSSDLLSTSGSIRPHPPHATAAGEPGVEATAQASPPGRLSKWLHWLPLSSEACKRYFQGSSRARIMLLIVSVLATAMVRAELDSLRARARARRVQQTPFPQWSGATFSRPGPQIISDHQ